VPVEGFKGLRGQSGLVKFKVVKMHGPGKDKRLPQSHTCFNQFDLPEYSTQAITKKQILMAIKGGKTFGLA
jgi:E3 ubiquitin-protein ligase HUWE1